MSSAQLGHLIAQGLAEAGIGEVVICPGSRSTAIAIGLAETGQPAGLRLHTRTDERVAGFLGLGLARASGAAAVVVTSGTAVGNLLPAVMEAKAAGVPLVVITADRPATLIGTGANQTCEQIGIFGRQVVADLHLASTDAAPAAWRAGLARVLTASQGLRTRDPGPVHINAAFTEPFTAESGATGPVATGSGATGLVTPGLVVTGPGATGSGIAGPVTTQPAAPGLFATESATESGLPKTTGSRRDGFEAQQAGFGLRQVAHSRPGEPISLPGNPPTVVLVGEASPTVGQRARRLATAAQLPLLAEPASNARAGNCAIAGYRLLLDGPLGQRIERVLCFGHPTLSRPVSRLLARSDIELVVVSDRASWPDAGWQAKVVADDVKVAPGPPGWLAEWRRADHDLVERGLDDAAPARDDDVLAPAGSGKLTGRQVAAAVVAASRGNLVFGASTPIRDADLAPIVRHAAEVCYWANRGLSGIDGVISTACGIALATARPTTVLLGDLGFLHDLGALHLPAGQPVPDLRIVVADDNGGSIFAQLEIANVPWFEQLFAMPHGRDLVKLAAGFGWPSRRVNDLAALRAELARPVTGLEVIVATLG